MYFFVYPGFNYGVRLFYRSLLYERGQGNVTKKCMNEYSRHVNKKNPSTISDATNNEYNFRYKLKKTWIWRIIIFHQLN
jgi:hypothetical protein